jgi:hypothetical protein
MPVQIRKRHYARKNYIIVRLLKKFSYDNSIVVKKELGLLLKDFCNNLDDDIYIEIVSNLIKEKNEFSRIPIFDCIVALSSHKSLSKLQDFIFSVVTNLSNDECWRVRYTIAERLHEVISPV